MGYSAHTQQKAGWSGYLAFFITIISFSGVLAKGTERQRVFDFTVLNGAFGRINTVGDMAVSFRGTGGMGAKGGFLFALELVPPIVLSLRIISATEGLGGLRVAQQLMTPVLHPLLGIPGICSLALIANLRNTDAAAGMTKETAEKGIITEQKRAISAYWQTNGSARVINYLSSGTTLFTMVTVPVITPLAVILIFKFVSANLLRVQIAQLENRRAQQET